MIPEIHDIKPDPLMDQHFLVNPQLVKKIVYISDLKPEDTVLEIGAGIGTLTHSLVKTKAKVIAVEMDRGFEKTLKKLKSRNLEIIYQDVLKIIDNLKFNKIVSNTPYYICEPLINKLLKRDFDFALLSVPEKFYRRISSEQGDKYYSLLTLKTKSFFKISLKFRIPKEDFYPEPKTESVVVLIEPLSRKDYEKDHAKYVTREIFLQGKKKLKNSLIEAIINLNKKILSKDFTKNFSKKVIKKMDMSEKLLEKKPEEIRLKDFEKLEEKFKIFL